MEIRCKKGDCKHNTGCSCSAKDVTIDKTTHCNSYNKDEIKENIIIENGNIFKVAEELVPKNLKDIPLACQAKTCLYNKQELCIANGITVISCENKNHANADCATFALK